MTVWVGEASKYARIVGMENLVTHPQGGDRQNHFGLKSLRRSQLTMTSRNELLTGHANMSSSTLIGLKQGQERRERPRSSTSLTARIFPGNTECTIMDVSSRGMGLRLELATPLPDLFVLVEWQAGEAHEAEVAWARGREVGIRILRSGDLHGRVPLGFSEARHQWTSEIGNG